MIPVSVSACADRTVPTLKCPSIIEVSPFGDISSNQYGFITKSTISDNCDGVVLNFDLPTAKGECSTPSVSQVSGLTNGSVFKTGTNVLRFEAKTTNGLTAQCDVQIRVTSSSLFTPDVDSLVICNGLDFTLNGKRSERATYKWVGSNGFNSPTQSIRFIKATANYTGMYTYILNAGNCTFQDSVYVKVLEKPTAVSDVLKMQRGTVGTGNVITNDTLVRYTPITVKVKTGVNTGSLNFNPNGTYSYIPPATFKGRETFIYQVCYDECPNACDIAKVDIDVLSNERTNDVGTNVITPNGDGVNDALVIDGLDPLSADNQSTITVYNQWGNIVYQASPYKNEWEGKFKDAPLPDGTYYYVFIKDANTEPIKTFVTIIR